MALPIVGLVEEPVGLRVFGFLKGIHGGNFAGVRHDRSYNCHVVSPLEYELALVDEGVLNAHRLDLK